MTTQESLVQELGDSLVLLARMKASIGPLLLAARQRIKQWDEEFKATGRRRNLYWPLKNAIAPLDKLASTVDNEFLLTVGSALELYKEQIQVEAIEQYKARLRERKAVKEESTSSEPVIRPNKRTKKRLTS